MANVLLHGHCMNAVHSQEPGALLPVPDQSLIPTPQGQNSSLVGCILLDANYKSSTHPQYRD